MAQITGPIIINDGQATPVARTFAPERVAPELSSFVEKTSGVSAGFLRLTAAFSPATSGRNTNRVDITFDYPVLQVVAGVSTVAYVGRFKGYFVVPDQMSAAERANMQAYVANAFASAPLKGLVKDLDPLY